MAITKQGLQAFYENCDYWPAKKRPRRPSELNIPFTVSQLNSEIITQLCASAKKGTIRMDLESNYCRYFSPILLHESLFHFYKAFYNYLAARTLYFGGMLHWINVTLYYSMFYLAKSITTLLGNQTYGVSQLQQNHNLPNKVFVEPIAKALAKDPGATPKFYRLRLELEMDTKEGVLIFDKQKVSSHRDVWHDYHKLPIEALGLHLMNYFSENENYLLEERNEENYSFEGYMQLDFNLPVGNFDQYFERDYIKSQENTVYDETSGGVWLALCSQLRLYRNLNISNIPIENEKFAFMIEYCLPNSELKDKLLMLCKESFPTEQLYSNDGTYYFDDQDRLL